MDLSRTLREQLGTSTGRTRCDTAGGADGRRGGSGPGRAETPYAGLVLHLNRELIHHGAEICLLRDLYARREQHG